MSTSLAWQAALPPGLAVDHLAPIHAWLNAIGLFLAYPNFVYTACRSMNGGKIRRRTFIRSNNSLMESWVLKPTIFPLSRERGKERRREHRDLSIISPEGNLLIHPLMKNHSILKIFAFWFWGRFMTYRAKLLCLFKDSCHGSYWRVLRWRRRSVWRKEEERSDVSGGGEIPLRP